MLEIVIANTAEAFAALLDKAGPDADRTRHELDLAGRALFWGGRNKIVVMPHPIDPGLIAYATSLLDAVRLEVWYPARSSLRLNRDILDDPGLMKRLRRETDGSSPFLVRPYAITPEFCELSERLGCGCFRGALEAAIELDSKAGFRRAFSDGRLKLPEGWICEDIRETAVAVHTLAEQGREAVVKVHNGESGWGMRFLDPPDTRGSGLAGWLDTIAALFDSDPIWSAGPYVVEERLGFDASDPGFSPSAEGIVDSEGVHFDYLCHQLVSEAGEFAGVCIGGEVEHSRHGDAVRRLTLVVGEALYARSYIGTYDVDFIADLAGDLYAVESNVRLTGGTHVIGAARALFGEEWWERTFISDDCIRYGDEPLPPNVVLARLGNLVLRRGGSEGIIISFMSATRPVLGAIAVAADQATALGQLEAVRRILQSSNP